MAVVVITAAKEEVSERLLLIRCKDGVTFLSFGFFSVELFPVSF